METKNISNLQKTQCYGCSACVHTCPFDAIVMEADEEGFLYPVVIQEKCTHCGKCRMVCPALREKDSGNSGEPECYAVLAEDKIRMESSSGGMFTLLANKILADKGVVCGVILDGNFEAKHVFIESQTELAALRGSKYIQSDVSDVFSKVQKYLADKRKVLFVGTPCQVAGLKTYLGQDDENLLTADLMCHGVASPKVFQQYLDETYERENLKRFKFRTKHFGYSCTTCVAEMNNGQKFIGYPEEDAFERGFHNSLFLRKSCADCKFAEIPRWGDFTIGDFWGISSYNKELNDQKGTSLVIINTSKAQKIFDLISSNAKVVEKVPLEIAVKHNRFNAAIRINSQRKRFFEMINYTSVQKAVVYCMENRYDVGLLGVWFGCNYGSIATYYGLMKLMESMGLSVLMIDKPGFTKDDRELAEENHSRIFAKNHFHVSKRYKLSEMRALNQICDAFVVGSDQVWNYGICRNFGRSFLMDFAREEKKKIAVAVSFGHDCDFRPDRERIISSEYLKRFDAISVREESAVGILNKVFHVEGTQVLDPVFSTDRAVYDEIADESTRRESKPYILTYILDPTPEKKEAVKYISDKMGLRTLHILDGTPWNFEENKEKMNMDTILENINFQDWVYYFKNSSYVITDSCHGMSFAIIYRKPFVGIANAKRGMTRFHSLTRLFHLENRLVTNAMDILKNKEFLEPIDYTQTDKIMASERARSIEWLRDALFKTKEVKNYQVYSLRTSPISSEDTKQHMKKARQVKRTLPRTVYYHLPGRMQKYIKGIVNKHMARVKQK